MIKPLIIIGLQKSGTSLLKRVLASSDHVINLFTAEGNGLWGNIPPFSPNEAPVGTIYQKYNSANGHYLSCEDFCSKDADLVHTRLKKELSQHKHKSIWLHKNPYLTVRLSWLKQIFPDAVVLACVRKPLPNVFSLLKRYKYSAHGLKPEKGWWGIKPKCWQSMVDSDSLITAAQQWHWVNHQLLSDSEHVDYFVPYHVLATTPDLVLGHINDILSFDLECTLPPINCMDNQWKTGGSVVSANQGTDNGENSQQISKMTEKQVLQVNSYCSETWKHIEQVLKCQA